ncbi:hypothetical protein Tcan_00655, partial [Toxocara canis]
MPLMEISFFVRTMLSYNLRVSIVEAFVSSNETFPYQTAAHSLQVISFSISTVRKTVATPTTTAFLVMLPSTSLKKPLFKAQQSVSFPHSNTLVAMNFISLRWRKNMIMNKNRKYLILKKSARCVEKQQAVKETILSQCSSHVTISAVHHFKYSLLKPSPSFATLYTTSTAPSRLKRERFVVLSLMPTYLQIMAEI